MSVIRRIELPLASSNDELRVYTVEEAARLLRIGRSAAYEAVRRGQIPAVRLGRRLRVPRIALEHLLSRPPDSGTSRTSVG